MPPFDLADIPHLPGCYLYKDGNGAIIYVGKAKDLKKRVSSYFQKKDHDPKTQKLVETIRFFEYIVTETEEEAYLLENTLIKHHQPKYNIDLKDAKSYAYIELTKEQYPRITIARKTRGDGQFFGPFVSGKERDHVLSVVKKTFRLRSCKTMPKNRPCLRYHIGNCSGPCGGHISPEDYKKQCSYAADVLKGNTKEIKNKLEEEMEVYAKNTEFEAALLCRDMITAVENLSARQYVARKIDHDEDVIAYRVRDGLVYLLVFHVYKGTLGGRDEFIFDAADGFFEEFVARYYTESPAPKEIIVEEELDEALGRYLGDIAGHIVKITVPKQGAKKKLLELAGKNIETTHFGEELKVTELQAALRLKTPPSVIECFDISHLSGTDTVASMVQFRAGRPDKRNYRRFKIKTVDGIDDFASMAEVVRRRYSRLIEEEKPLPDLIVIDGGKGQLSSAKRILDELEADIPLISLAKAEEEVFVSGVPFPLPFGKKTKANMYLQEIRDEAHRFAVTYNRLLRKKRLIK
ncbi:MAG TPA: excinuclease ABC subunit UvrC [Methanocorpusculum sp.]|nr:excinuclease ABC subunit UvrC [Methanocorpusculum sp.]HJJ53791.1 excinuclease ABC subunit UvrC [Methanocorpusculum sp.]